MGEREKRERARKRKGLIGRHAERQRQRQKERNRDTKTNGRDWKGRGRNRITRDKKESNCLSLCISDCVGFARETNINTKQALHLTCCNICINEGQTPDNECRR